MKKSFSTFFLTLALVLMSVVGANAQTSSAYLDEDFGTGGTSQGSFSALKALNWDTLGFVQGTGSYSTSYWGLKSSSGVTGSCAYLDAYYYYVSEVILVSPQFTLDGTKDAVLTFKYKNGYDGGKLDVYVIESNGTRTQLAADLNPGSTWTSYEYSLKDFKGKAISIGFKGKSSGQYDPYYYYYIDDVVVEDAPDCQSAVGLAISNLTQNGAALTWQPKGDGFGFVPSKFHISVVNVATGVTVLTDTTENGSSSFTDFDYTFSTLDPNTTYRVAVLNDCSRDYKSDTASAYITFTTLKAAQNPPYQENFDNITTTLPDGCYSVGTVKIDNNTKYGTSGKSLKIVASATGDAAMFIMPALNLAANNAEIEFQIKGPSSNIKYKVGFLFDPTAPGDFIPILSDSTGGISSWREVACNSSASPITQTNVMFAILVESGASGDVYIDNIDIHQIPTCIRPENITVSNITNNSADVSWTTANAQNFEIRLHQDGGAWTTYTATGSPFTMTGLTANTKYDSITVQGICGGESSRIKVYADPFTTLCDVAASPFFTEGFESVPTTGIPQCWNMGWIVKTTGSSSYCLKSAPFITSTSYKHAGSKSMSLQAQCNGTISYLSTATLPIDSADKYTLSIWVYRTSASSYPNEGIQIWETDYVGDTTGGTMLAYIHRDYASAPVESNYGWYQYEYPIPVAGNKQITIIGISEYGSATYFDDMEVKLTPTCFKVTGVTVGNTTTNSTELSWTPTGDETDWIVRYTVKQGTTVVASDTSLVSGQPKVTINGLQPASTYVVTASVAAYCGAGDTAEVVSMAAKSITTACNTLTTFPYTEDFESQTTGVVPTCWTLTSTSTTTTASSLWSTYSISTSAGKCLRIYNYMVQPGFVAIDMPKMTFATAPMELNFDYSHRASCDPLVLLITDDNGATYDTLGSYPSGSTTSTIDPGTYTRVNIDLTAYASKTVSIRFATNTDYDEGAIFVDNINVREIPSCADLTGTITVTATTDTSFSFTIADQTATEWQYAYGPKDTPIASLTPVSATGSAAVMISGLAAATSYDIYVRRECSGQYGAWSAVTTVMTMATPAQIPYTCGFEVESENNSWMFVQGANTSNNFIIGTFASAVETGSKSIYLTTATDGSNNSYNFNTSSRNYAYRTINFEAKGYTVSLDWKCNAGEGTGTIWDYARIMLVPASEPLPAGQQGTNKSSTDATSGSFPTNAIFFDPEGSHWISLAGAGQWHSVSKFVDMTNQTPGLWNLVLVWNNDGSSYTTITEALAVDNISIVELTCIPPSTTLVSDITPNSANINIQQTGATEWEVLIDDSIFDARTIPADPMYRQITTNATVSLTGLTPNTQYYYTVRNICGPQDTSDWKTPIDQFQTFCSSVQVPLNEGFEGVTSTNCWTSNSATGSISRSTTIKHTGTASMMVKASTAISPEFNTTSLAGYMLNGWYYTTADSVKFSILVGTDPNEVTSFEPLTDVTVPASAKSQWTEFTVYFSDISGWEDPQDYKYIGITCQDNTIYFDDFIIDNVPTCPKPTETVISNITDTSFTISYTNNAPNATKWIVYTNGEEHVITTSPAVISGLEPATNYNVSMVAFCSATDTSYVTTVATIRTECAITRLPYNCGFETSEGFSSSSSSYVAGDLETNCWNTLNMASGTPYYYYSSTAAHSGSRGLVAYCSSSKYGYLILPVFSADINNLTMDFWYSTYYDDYYEEYSYLYVGYMTDITADSTFVLLETITESPDNMTKHTTSFAGRSIPVGARIAFRYIADYSYEPVNIDDISVKEIRSCSDPDAPAVSNVTATSASVQFSDTCATHSNWEYVYGVQGFNPDQVTPITLDTNVVELSGLTGETPYTVYVRAVCGVNDYSNWVGTSFRTLCTPFNVSVANPFYDAFEEYNYGDDLVGSCYTLSTPASSGYYYTSAHKVVPTSEPSSTSSYRYLYSHTGDYTSKSLSFTYYQAANSDGFYMIRQIHLEAGKTYEASMWACNSSSYNGDMIVSMLIGQSGVLAQMDTLKSASISYENYTYSSQGGVYTYDYTGCYRQIKTIFTVQSTGDYHVAFTANYYDEDADAISGYFDDLQIREFSGCAPAPVALDSITATSVKVTIADQDPNHSFEYVLNDTSLQSTVVTSNNFTISGLASSSSFTLYVRVLCDQTSHSEWTAEQFNTLCGSINEFPYLNDFESYPVSTTPNCWDISSSTALTGTTSPEARIWGVYNYGSNNMLRMWNYWVYYGTANIETPVFELPAQPVEMQFDYSHLADCGAWKLKASTDNGATYTELASYTATSSSYSNDPGTFTHAIVDLTAYANQNVKFMFASTATYSSGAIFLDNLQVSFVPPCRDPQTAPVIASSTMTTMTVTAGMAGKDTIEFGIAPHSATVTSADIVDSVVSATGTATFQGLTGNTQYAVWYRYHCGEDGISGWSLAYANNTTTSTDCFAPQNLRTVGIVNDHHAAITWGKAPEAVGYEYMLMRGGAVLDSAVNLNDTIVYDSLTANTAYTFKARTLCGTDTSAWATINFTTTYPCFSLPFICDFEDPTINNGWRLSDVYTSTSSSLFAIGNATSNGGVSSLYVSDDGGATCNYTTTTSVCDAEVLLEMPAGNYTVSYDWYANGEGGTTIYDYGRVFIVPSTETITSPYYYTYRTLPTSAISLDNNAPLLKASGWTNYQSIISIPTDNVYKLVVLWANDPSAYQPPLAVDNIRIEVANCMPLASVTALAVNATSAKVAINRYDATNDAEYGYSTVDSEDSITWTVIPAGQKIDTVKLTGLNPQTSYYFYAREVCDSGNVSAATRLEVKTTSVPQSIPFVCSFEASQPTTTAWQFANSENGFVVGNAGASDGTKALYISNNGSAWTYTPAGAISSSYAYIPLAFGPGTYEISFDWQANGESTWDYGRAFLTPATFVPTEGQTSGISTSGTPQGWISLDGDAKMNLVTEWKSVYVEQTFTDSVTLNLLFYWRNDNSTGYDNPLGIDNIRINQQTCPTMKFDSISTDTITEDMMIVRYVNTNVGASTRWVVFRDAQRTDTVASGVNLATDSTITLQGLSAGTSYYFSLYSVCSPTDESRALEFYVRTVCANTVLPYTEGFENMKPNTYNLLTANCWYTTAMTADKNAFADATYQHNGSYCLVVDNGYNTSTQVLALPEMDSINGLSVSFWHMAYGTYSGYATLKFGYLNASNTFVSLQSLTKNTSWSEYTTVTSGIPAGVNRLAFQITGYYDYYIDDIRVNKLVAGRDIYDTICNGVAYNKYGVSIPARRLNTGDTTFTQTILGTTAGEADSIATIHLYVRPAIMTVINDTVCQGQSYNKHGFTIGTPQTSQYTQKTTAACGCDSSLVLNLYVMPVTATLRDTICQGDVYQFGSQSLTQPGTYVDTVPSGYGCDIQRTLYLFVVDSTTTTRATICEGTSYRFEGQDYTQTGIYRVPSTGLHGCSLTKILDLTVTKTVRDIDTSFCKGGQLIIADGRVITTPGTYTCTIADEPTGCTTTYNYTVSEDPIISATATDDACENHTYTGLGGLVDRRITKDTTFTVTTRTIDAKCDSQCVVTIKLVKAIWAQPDVVDKPAGETYTWHGNSYNKSVVVQDTLQSIVTGCDSICKLILTIGGVPPVAVENVELLEISLIPNPVTAGQTSFIYGNFSDVKNVEVLNSFGQVVDSFVPSTYPIEVQGINASGIYYVRITTEDERVAVQKLIVK